MMSSIKEFMIQKNPAIAGAEHPEFSSVYVSPVLSADSLNINPIKPIKYLLPYYKASISANTMVGKNSILESCKITLLSFTPLRRFTKI